MLLLKNPEKLRLSTRPSVVSRKDVGSRALHPRLENRAFALFVEVLQKLLSVVCEIAQRHEQTGLLVVVVVAERPLHFGERRILSVPCARSLIRRQRALYRFRSSSISMADMGVNPVAIARFCFKTSAELIPLMVTATGRLPYGWVAALQIPFLALGDCQPVGTWRANFCRIERPENQPRELSSWSPTYTGSFQVPERFGLLHFE